MLCSCVWLQSHSHSCVSMLYYSHIGWIRFFFSIYSKHLKIFLNSYFERHLLVREFSLLFFSKIEYGFWSMPFFLTLNAHCPALISPKIYTFLTDKTRDAVYGRPPWAHKSIKETQFAGKTICCSTNGVIPITLNLTAFI